MVPITPDEGFHAPKCGGTPTQRSVARRWSRRGKGKEEVPTRASAELLRSRNLR